jgi:hypothetical protein
MTNIGARWWRRAASNRGMVENAEVFCRRTAKWLDEQIVGNLDASGPRLVRGVSLIDVK